MTVKEKAKELVGLFLYHSKPTELGINFSDINHVKECALICCNQLIKCNEVIFNYEGAGYLKEVKKEIEKL